MILQCPTCNARFMVPDAAIGTTGRNVRCGKCKHEWFCAPPAEAATTPSPPPAPAASPDIDALMRKGSIPAKPAGSSAPASPPGANLPAPRIVYPSALTWASCMALMAVTALLVTLTFAPARLGFLPSKDIQISAISFQRLPEDKASSTQTNVYKLEGDLVNASKDMRMLPQLRMSILSANSVLKRWTVPLTASALVGGDRLHFVIENIEIPKGVAAQLRLDVGNSMELALRSM